jgi:hypothetical protein
MAKAKWRGVIGGMAWRKRHGGVSNNASNINGVSISR